MSYPIRLCAGVGMRICDSCHRNADLHTAAERDAQPTRLTPFARPPHCADWRAIPETATDASHSRL